MSMFSNLMGKIFGHASTATQTASTAPAAPAPADTPQATGTPGAPAAPTSTPANAPVASTPAAPAAPAQNVDVAAVLHDLAAKNSEKLDWQKSIVDLLKLVGMDSSLSARKELAKELAYTGDTDDSATMNMWLHKQVMQKMAANGGKVPAELLT